MDKPESRKADADSKAVLEMEKLLGSLSPVPVCKTTACPNMSACLSRRSAAWMILGGSCLRRCAYCDIAFGEPDPIDESEPAQVAEAAKALGLSHIVITAPARDDLPDSGAAHIARTIAALKGTLPSATVEVLIPDLKGDRTALKVVLDAQPDILSHSVGTVPSLYRGMRPASAYTRSLELLGHVKELSPRVFTKSGLWVGLGETGDEAQWVLDDLRAVGCDFLTIGQYEPPTPEHMAAAEEITPEAFESLKSAALDMGFRDAVCGPLARMTYASPESLAMLASKRKP